MFESIQVIMARRKLRRKRIKAPSWQDLVFTLFFVAVLLVGVWKAPDWIQSWRLIRVTFVDSSGNKTATFALEPALKSETRQKGLMFRKPESIPEYGGMFFAFPGEAVQQFWMKNTFTSLDMIFVNSSYRVVGILHSVPILNPVMRKVDQKSKYVIELHAGTAGRHGIESGDRIEFLKNEPSSAEIE